MYYQTVRTHKKKTCKAPTTPPATEAELHTLHKGIALLNMCIQPVARSSLLTKHKGFVFQKQKNILFIYSSCYGVAFLDWLTAVESFYCWHSAVSQEI